MTRDDLLAASREPNVRAFLDVIAACEGTARAGPDGYRMLFGGSLIDSLADHPRRVVSASMNGKPISSSAAGRYQFLRITWDELARRYGFPTFEPQWQDAGAVALIIRRGALDAVRAGDLGRAVDLCRKEWASLPGSPYGQPTKSSEFVRRTFLAAGGTLIDAEAPIVRPVTIGERPAELAERPLPDAAGPEPPPPSQPAPENRPMAPFLAAALPSLIALIPELGKLFGSGSKVSDRNAKALEKVAEVVVAATGAPNVQGAVEAMQRDPATASAARSAVREIWYELEEVGGGVEAARAWGERMTSGSDLRSLGYGLTIGALALLIVVGGGLLIWMLLRDPATTGEQRGMLIGAVVALMGSVVAYFFGSSASSRAKDLALAKQVTEK